MLIKAVPAKQKEKTTKEIKWCFCIKNKNKKSTEVAWNMWIFKRRKDEQRQKLKNKEHTSTEIYEGVLWH